MQAEKICREGLLIGNTNLFTLSKPEMGVYVCKHADVVRFSRWQDGDTGYIIMFKIVKVSLRSMMYYWWSTVESSLCDMVFFIAFHSTYHNSLLIYVMDNLDFSIVVGR